MVDPVTAPGSFRNMYLAIDCTTATAGVAVINPEGNVRAELVWDAGRNHTAELYPAIEEILRRGRTTRDDLTGLIVAIGPGSFTGIRIGMATAKGLAIALGVPLVGIGTLAAATHAFAWTRKTVWGVLDAGRGQIVAAAFRADATAPATQGSEWRCVVEEQILDPEGLCAAIASADDGHRIVCGEVPAGVEELVLSRFPDSVVVPPRAALIRRPGSLARLGWSRLRQGDSDDPLTLAPRYARPPAALERIARK